MAHSAILRIGVPVDQVRLIWLGFGPAERIWAPFAGGSVDW
jgi:hypothetical protein